SSSPSHASPLPSPSVSVWPALASLGQLSFASSMPSPSLSGASCTRSRRIADAAVRAALALVDPRAPPRVALVVQEGVACAVGVVDEGVRHLDVGPADRAPVRAVVAEVGG